MPQKNDIFEHEKSIFLRALLLSNIPVGMFILGGPFISDPRVFEESLQFILRIILTDVVCSVPFFHKKQGKYITYTVTG